MASANALSFNPTDEELILRFLSNKANGKPLPNDATNNIHECDDFYGEKNPWEIWEAFGGGNKRELYFFTIKKKKSSRLVRTIGLGSWEAENNKGGAIVAKGTHRRIGTKKCLWLVKSGTNHDGAWIMHEYSLHSSLLTTPYYANNYVLCKLFKSHGNHIQQKTGIRQEVTRPRTRPQSLAASTNNNGGLGDTHKRPIKSQNGQLQAEGDDDKAKVDGTTATAPVDYEEHVDTKEPPIEEEDIQLIPNPFARDLLLERIDGKYFGSSSY